MATYLFDNSKNLVDIDSSGNKYGFDEVKNRLLFNNQDSVYGVDEYKNFVSVGMNIGDTIALDGIECLCIYDNPYIFVDKNHDLSYYFSGSDYVNEWLPIDSAKYGYEWGGYGTETGIRATAVGTGLSNTNQLISKNLQPYISGWWVVWDKVNEFRQSHSDKWFVPSKDELNLVYENRAYLSNLSLNRYYFYWSSSESSSDGAWYRNFDSGLHGDGYKRNDFIRVRLCRTL